ncbi:MAG: hypothetical protein M3271_03755, partial [Actinomycetota bacterium]|nr:hypothetical protein [Actinomycetota bacterium]
GGVADQVRSVSPAAGDAVEPVEALLEPASAITLALPDNPTQALIDSTSALSSELGFPQDTALRIQAAGLSDEVAGRLALVVQELLACTRTTTAHYAAIEDRLEEVMRDGDGLDPATFSNIRMCADALWTAATELELSMERTMLTPTDPTNCDLIARQSIDIWPVLRLDASCATTTYLNDYLLIVDLGGHDKYINNVGANLVDLNFAPAGSLVRGARGFGPSRGCDRAVGGLAAGDCTPAAALLLDLQGEDTLGVKQAPTIDAQCTSEPVIRRLVTGGAGFLGVGILRDAGDMNDVYTGKTGALGSGHIFGVGILSDEGGNERYEAVRNSEGFALVGGAGLLHDEAGKDTYTFHVPLGGVIDDQDLCDADPRFVQGAGNVLGPTIGILLDDAGGDNYTGGFSADFDAPAPQATTGRGGSQGFGNNGGFGILFDRGGARDSYTILGGDQGNPRRHDGATILPDPQCAKSTCSGGVFIDR